MEKFALQPGEQMVVSGMMALRIPYRFPNRLTQGMIYLTTQRLVFEENLTHQRWMDYSLHQVKGFFITHFLWMRKIGVRVTTGDTHWLTGFPIRKLEEGLVQLGVPRWE